MSVISSPTVVPSRLIALTGALGALGGSAEIGELWRVLFPEPLRRATAGTDDSSPSMADELRRESLSLGIVEAVGPKLSLTDRGRQFASQPRRWLADVLLDPAQAAAAGQSDVPSAMVWLLQQDPLAGLAFQGSHASSLRTLLGAEASISNMADFQQLFHWARYLGYCWWIRTRDEVRVVPDPWSAISGSITEGRLPIAERLTVRDFVRTLGAACPVLEGGTARAAVDRLPGASLSSLAFTTATGIALERLHDEGTIKLEAASDADFMLAGLSQGSRRISHVTIGGGAS